MKPRSSARSAATPRRKAAPKGKLDRAELERYLWESADILRGSIDSADYKHYILGLLFLKRLSDRFQEESEAQEAEPRHEIIVPPSALWSAVQAAASNVGDALNAACSAIESQNP